MKNSENKEVLDINCILYTKDGRIVGNALVTGKTDKGWIVTTDYGNILENISEKEIEELYYIGHNHNGKEEMLLSMDMRETHKNFVQMSSNPSLTITYDAKCKHCKWFDFKYNGLRKVHRCNLTEENLTLKSKACDKFEL